MGIKIVEQSEIGKGQIAPALLFPRFETLYQNRTQRLKNLAENHPMGDYLNFIAELTTAQQKALMENPLTVTHQFNEQQLSNAPLNAKKWQRDNHWIELLKLIINELKPIANETTLGVMDWLEKASIKELNQVADHLLNEEFHLVENNKALFIWAALMVYWRQLTQQIPHQGVVESGANLTHCPVCNTTPVASVVHMGGEKQGVRYLHCALCETQWHTVRAKCTNCEQTGKVSYLMLDNEQAAIRAESCDDCQSYLKIFYHEQDPNMDILADDLASLILDIELDEKGYARSGLNPYFFTNIAG